MKFFKESELQQLRAQSKKLYLEFLKVPSLSCGLYELAAGSTDPQSPHTEDEVYYVISGTAQITVNEETKRIEPGDIIFVAAHDPHKFHDIKEDLSLLVFFAPPEGTLGGE